MLIPLTSTPTLSQVDTQIFTLRYFANCMACTFCHDICCQYGADTDLGERERILAQADSIREMVTIPPDQWFTDDVKEDPDYPSGEYVRTRVVDGTCAFRNRRGRGCLLHAWAIAQGKDYHDIKPLVCWLFPITFDRGLLRPSFDITDGLICTNQGPTLYRSARHEVQYFFGEPLVRELDEIEARVQDTQPLR